MKLNVQPGDTPDIFAARYGLTVDRLKQLNDGEVAARDELNRAGGAVDPDKVIRGVAQLETGITTDILATKIPVGVRVAAPALDQNFEYYTVGDSRPTARIGAPTPRSYTDMAGEYLETNPGEAL